MLIPGYALVRTVSVVSGMYYGALAPPAGEWLVWVLIAALAVSAGVGLCLALRRWGRGPAPNAVRAREHRGERFSAPQSPPARYCYDCGARMKKDDVYCRRCGARRRGA